MDGRASIKFRVWNNEKNDYDYFEFGNILTYLDEFRKHLLDGDFFEMSSGCFDRNSKEIYQGDLVRGYDYDGTVKFDAVVIFSKGVFRTYFECWDVYPSVDSWAVPLEIMGQLGRKTKGENR